MTTEPKRLDQETRETLHTLGSDFVKLLRENFWAGISLKTGWGNQELKLVFERAMSNTLTQLYEKHP